MTPNIKLKRSAVAGRVPSVDQLELGEVAINTADGKMYIKRDVGGTETIVLVNDAQEGIWKQYSYTATAAQTTFSGSDANSQVLAYSVGYAEVYLNGILLDPAVDYTANTGYSIELTVAAEADDVLQIDSFSSTIGPGDIVTNTFTGDNSTVSFTLTTDPGVEDNVFVYIDGVYQEKETYSVNGSSLVFSEAPYTDASIEALIGSRNITLGDINDLSITGDFSALGTISGNIFSGTSATLTGQMSSGSVSTSAITATTIDTTDDITTTTDVNANNVVATNDITATNDVEGSSLTLTGSAGAMTWNSDEETVDIPLNADVTLQVGQEQVFRIKASGAISNGQVVMFVGAQGDHILASVADLTSVGFKPEYIIGIATQDFANNEYGFVTSMGKVRDLDTSAFSEGTLLYADPTTAGALTSTKPAPPNHIIQMAAVLRSHATEGTLLVRPQHFSDTDEIEEGSTNLYYTDDRVSGLVNTAFIANLVDATNIDYDNTVSGISANTVQEAIDYLNTLSGGGNQGDVASYTREKFTATADQTTFTLTDGYTLGYLEVFLNGVLLDTSDYTANDESTVVLGVSAKAGDELITIALDSFAIAELLRVTSISASAPDDCLNVTADGTLRIALSDETPLYGRGNTGNLDLLNTNTGNTEGGWLSFSGNMGNPTPSYQMAAITAGKDSAEGDNNYAGHLSLWTTSGGANGEANSGQYERVRIDGLGRVGIGVSNPLTRLQVEESTGETIPFRFGNSSGANTYLSLYNSGSVNPWDAKIGTTGTDLRLATSNTDRIIIDSTGNVGIGTDSPILPLDVHGGTIGVTSTTAFAGLQITAKNNSFAYVNFGDEDDGNVGQINYNHVDNNMKFITNNSPRLTINSTGLVGIRTTDPQDWLHVVGTSSGAATFKHYYSYAQPNYCLKIEGQDNTPNGYIQQNPAQGGLLLTNGLTYYGSGNWVVDANTTGVTTMSMAGDHFSFNVREDVTAGSTIGTPAQVCRIDANGITAPNGVILGSNAEVSQGPGGDTILSNTSSGADILLSATRNTRFFNSGNEQGRFTSTGLQMFSDAILSGESFAQTGTSGSISLVDTGILATVRGSWLLVVRGNLNANGSGVYAGHAIGIVTNSGNYLGGNVTNEINYTELATGRSGSSNLPPDVSVKFWNGGAENDVIINSFASSNQIRIKIGGYNAAVTGASQTVTMLRIG